MIFVPPSSGELYYLRLLLNIVKRPTSYAEIQTYNGVIYSSFRDTCYVRGLLDDDKEYIDAIEKVSHWDSDHYLRRLFATLLWSNSMVCPEAVWEKTAMLLSDEILHDHKAMFGLHDLALSDKELKNLTLIEIKQILNSNGKEKEHNECFSKLIIEQRRVYDKIINASESQHGRVFFSYGHGDGFSTCNIKQRSPLAELIVTAKIIIWDKTRMMSKFCFEALDKTIRDLMRFKDYQNKKFPSGEKQLFSAEILDKSYQWSRKELDKISYFGRRFKAISKWILQVGNRTSEGTCDGCNMINIPPELLITNYNDPIQAMIKAIYSNYIAYMANESHLKVRAILASIIYVVDEVNDYTTAMNNNQYKTYISSNKSLSEGGSTEIDGIHTP
ncbi:uncharacterized protein LOC130935402 [Arachis stenosperma]|uniref:uncharacterized protein LOC130935402 n=1 Tax=Arachis stenosperma TaxID=217475 RepID=UPI0025AC23B3|nr:uncharacterized protein LOC130935402 [Arachis stenosperma]